MKPEKFPVDGITLHCDPEVSCNFIALTALSFDMILMQGEFIETGVPWLISPEFDPDRKGFD